LTGFSIVFSISFDTIMNDLIILACLLPGPTYGYALKKTAGMAQGGGELHPNVVYPLLRQFVERGWVSQTTEPGERGQERKKYSITPIGKTELIRRLEEFDQSTAAESGAFLLRVSMFGLMSQESRHRVLRLRAEYLRERHRRLKALRDQFNPAGFGGTVQNFSLSRITHELRWIGEIERQIQEGQIRNRGQESLDQESPDQDTPDQAAKRPAQQNMGKQKNRRKTDEA